MHLICPPPQISHNLCFSFLLGIAVVPREIENNSYAKFWGEIKCIMEDVQVAYRLCKVWGGGGQIRCIMGNLEVAYG